MVRVTKRVREEFSCMRVLWVCNRCLPVIAAHLNMDAGNREGWLAGLSERILAEKNEELTLGVCFPAGKELAEWKGEYEVTAYGFYEDTNHPEEYDEMVRLTSNNGNVFD